jgi:tRNA G46 methylase TrmB
MDAPFMSLEQHERGIHALRSGANGARVTNVRFIRPDVRPCIKDQPDGRLRAVTLSDLFGL